jgi:hypothetical protein
MKPMSKAERKLRMGIEAMMDKANWEMYGRSLSKDERRDNYLRDIIFLEKLAMQVSDQIECRKASEKVLRETLQSTRYRIESTIEADSFEYLVLRP